MNINLLISIFGAYTLFIFLISWLTARRANDDTYYRGNRRSPWYIVAYGMIGSSLSGVTFLSEPGAVYTDKFSYMMVVLGYMVGYAVIAFVLLPLYYRLNLTSIYSYLSDRFGKATYRTGASFFILSRMVGSALRMFLAVYVLHSFIFSHFGVPFPLLGAVFIIFILLYTFKGGIKTVVWTDTLQTTFMMLSVCIAIYAIGKEMGWGLFDIVQQVGHSEYSRIINTDWSAPQFFLKQFLSGIFITIVMTGLDQDMMQKNLSCRNLRDAQKNMLTFGGLLLPINLLFLSLGAVLVMYAGSKGIVIERTDRLFAEVAINQIGSFMGVVFVMGLISAAYSSADGTMTAITTSFCIDILGIDRRRWSLQRKKFTRYAIHGTVALLQLSIIIAMGAMNNTAIINRVFQVAGYTYGPLLGLYAFGICCRQRVRDGWVPLIAVLSPLVTFMLDYFSVQLLWGYHFGFELLIVNGLLTFGGLWLSRKR